MLEIRPPQTPSEIREMEQIQSVAWKMGERGITPHNTLKAWQHSGGVLLAAFVNKQMVGFVASLMAELKGKRAQWSHLAAVLPEYRRRGIARQLKLAQREAALARGIDLIGWTFDPLRRENAIFNLGILGAQGVKLHHHFYGDMLDGLNQGLYSDRFEVHWHLKDRKVQKLAQQAKIEGFSIEGTYVTSLEEAKLNLPLPLSHETYTLCLPSDLEGLRAHSLEAVRLWSEILREGTETLSTLGYQLAGVYAPPDQTLFGYTFQKVAPWILYLLETADGSFYIGITNNLDKRLKAHNAGKGAIYTASRRPVKVMAAWEAGERVTAMKLERQLKKLTRAQKEKLVASGADFETAIRFIHNLA